MFRFVSIKEFTYRGLPEQWSNGYTFTGSAPGDAAGWDAFSDAMWLIEKTFLLPTSKRAHYYGYTDPDGTAQRGLAYSTVGGTNAGAMTLPSGAYQLPGDVAMCVRFRAGQTSKGKPAYVMKYYHGPYTRDGSDTLDASIVTAITANAGKLRDGTLPGGAKLARPNGIECGVPQVIPYLTTRTLKRRGKRPPVP